MKKYLHKILNKIPDPVRQASVYGIALIATKGISFIMIPVFTHFLEPADYGRLDILQTLADLLSLVIAMGLADTLYRFAGEATGDTRRKEVAANIYGMALVISFLSIIIFQSFAPLIASILPGEVTVVQTRLILGSLSLGGCILIPLCWLRMEGLAGAFFKISVGRVCAQASLAVILLWLGFSVTGVMFAGFIAALGIAMILGHTFIRNTGIRFDLLHWKRYGAYGCPLILTGASGFIMGSFDRWILAGAVGPAEMAIYALAAKFGLITMIATQPFDLWWRPQRFAVLNSPNGKQRCANSVSIGFTIAIIAALGISACAPLMITFMTPQSYHGAIAYVPFLCALAALHAVTIMMNHGCYNAKTMKWPVAISIVSAGLAFAGYIILIPLYGAYGAIAATTLALSVRFTLTLMIGQSQTHIPYPLVRMAMLTGASLGMMAFIAALDNPLLQSAIGIVSAAAVLILSFIFKLIPSPFGFKKQEVIC